MRTELLRCDAAEERDRAVNAAVRLLRAGEIVALPTETVYGLAADALNSDAALKIFEAKERPRFDPLIVHLPDASWLPQIANVRRADEQLVAALTQNFWPGPLTLVLPRRPAVPDIVTAGLATVAVRVSAHPVFSSIVRSLQSPLAAPSANRFGRISPTRAEHVCAELDGRIPLIVDGGPTQHGLESTIVSFKDGAMMLLRTGPVTAEQLRSFGEVIAKTGVEHVEAPGQLPSHYAPSTALVLTNDLASFTVPAGKRVGALSWRGSANDAFAIERVLSSSGDLREAAANLFRSLRELDDAGLDLIVAERVPDHGLGSAILDRLRRAAA